ncbi:MAG: S8 family serine peptidase [Bacteroidia bacterium]|jgi:PKD repeat protein
MTQRLAALLLLLFSFVLQTVQAQQIPQSTSLEERFRQQYVKDRALAEEIARVRNIALRRVDSNGRVSEFAGFDSRGNMEFNITDNVGAGRTISTNKVWPGGTVGTSLTGLITGNRLGVWDGGATRLSHQEFGGRATQADGATGIIDHATHVAGTMIGSGVSANAKGMSYQASIRAYDWSNDASEMSAAANAGMLVSNHSYGTITGWYWDGSKSVWYGDPFISAQEDWRFGFYNSVAASWDDIVVNNPYYLICKSAGNDRGDTKFSTEWEYSNGDPGSGTPPPADGQYDCISTYSGAKNVLTVGAARKISNSNTNNGWTKTSDVVMSTFSAWGPMDDGRIKPDVVGCGVGVYSATSESNTSYAAYDGTSMATPNVSGSLLLVQQHYNNLKSKFMRASTLKGLTIHTADEAGNAGPDYVFGWGLVNIAKAVQTITDSSANLIQEIALTNGKSHTQSISTTGTAPLKITICWTDPAGSPVSPQLDPANKMLVNDLDIRLTRVSDNVIFFPYILVRDTPTALARGGDNITDNVEQIYLATPQAGNYSVKITHKGNLVGTQFFSLIISGMMGAPIAVVQASNRSICTGQSVTFTDGSSGSPTGRKWYFPGGSPSTSTASSPVVSYATAGKFPVMLVVSNALGKDSTYQSNYITAGGITLPFSETFENNSPTLSAWSISNPNADTTWRLANIGGTTPGNRAYCLPFYNFNTIGTRDGLISPALSFKGYGSVSMTFAHAYTRDPSRSTDSLIVWVSTNCGTNWIRVQSYGENGADNFRTVADQSNEFLPTSATQWCSGTNNNCITVNLNAYAGMNNIKIKLEGYNNYSNSLYIDNVNITGVPLVPVPNFYASKKTTCAGEPIQFFDSSQNIVTQWQWTFDGAQPSTSNQQNPTGIKYNVPGTYAVKLKAGNSSGSDSITKTAYITVMDLPGKPTISNSRPLTFCSGDSTVLVCDSAATTFQWIYNSTNLIGETNAQLNTANTGFYRVAVTNASGCKNQSDSVAVNEVAFPSKPTITSNLSSGFMCTGGTAILTSNTSNGNQWFKNGNILSGAVNNSFSTQDSGSYTVQVGNQGCLSPMSDPKTIALLQVPVTSAIQGKDSSMKNKSESYSVTNSVGSFYAWTITGGTKTSGGNTAAITVQWNTVGQGTVAVQETGTNGCKGIAKALSVQLANNTGLSEMNKEHAFQVFPNPASGFYTLTYYATANETLQVQLINALGQVVANHNWNTSAGMNSKRFELDGIPQGVYQIGIRSQTVNALQRLVIK